VRQIGCAVLVVLLALVALVASRVRFVSAGQGASTHVAPRPAASPAAGAVLLLTLPSPAPSLPPGQLAVPVAGVLREAIRDSWGDPRGGGTRGHHGTDIPAPAGTLVTAAAPGTIAKLFQSHDGGTTLYERSADGQWIYYYAHLSGYVAGTHEGQAVKTGDPIAYVGDTGDAGPGNFHLHFGLSHVAPGQGWWQGTDVDPYPLLAGKPAPR
jgi:peptidoglycan LD-endopeptidase LytH